MEVHIYSSNANSQAGNVWFKDVKTTWKCQSHKILS